MAKNIIQVYMHEPLSCLYTINRENVRMIALKKNDQVEYIYKSQGNLLSSYLSIMATQLVSKNGYIGR